mmetsp:Transcript_40115/g.95291  ORF Transcript_40115/g.95291 Transcript_40115/m.95291 type:complete len:1529 (-) Transcript_40115:153-4739(-)
MKERNTLKLQPAETHAESQQLEEEAAISVRLLKERLEMEVGLRREGLRCVTFTALCICFGTAFFLAIQPAERNRARWYISNRLRLKAVGDVTSPESVFSEVIRVSSVAREFFPLSSVFVEEVFSKTLVDRSRKFPGGPIRLPAESKPDLKLEWTFTFLLALSYPEDPLPKKRLIARSYVSGDASGYSCYAIYCQGMKKFILEYGRNTNEDGYPMIQLEFDLQNTETHVAATNFVAIQANTTHVSARLQGAGTVTRPLRAGTIPSDCPDATFEVGDVGITLASLVYHPRRLSMTELNEIESGGQTLEDLALGTAPRPGGRAIPTGNVEEHAQTQELVKDYGEAGVAMSKLAGLMSLVAAENATAIAGNLSAASAGAAGGFGGVLQPPNSSSAYAPPSDPSEAESWYVPVVSRGGVMVDTLQASERLSVSLAGAFGLLARLSATAFTISWWAYATAIPRAAELLIADRASSRVLLSVVHNREPGRAQKLWAVSINGAPWCRADERGNAADEACGRSPGVYCQAPDVGLYDGIWRHIAVDFGFAAEEDGRSRVALHVDGRLLCGVTFAADPELNPMPSAVGSDGAPTDAVPRMAWPDGRGPISLHLKDVRLYPRLLNASEVSALADDSELKECLDLRTNADDGEWVSEFGQTCTDLSELSKLSPRLSAPPACQLYEVQQRCPVSCMGILNPMCFDGVLPLPEHGSFFSLGSSQAFVAELLLSGFQADQETDLSDSALGSLASAGDFIGGKSKGSFVRLFREIRKLKYAEVVPSEAALARIAKAGAHQAASSLSIYLNSQEAINATTCPGLGVDHAVAEALDLELEDANIVDDICRADLESWSTVRQLAKAFAPGGTLADAVRVIGWHETQFQPELMPAGSSFTVYFWAKTFSLSARSPPYLSGIDSEQNICFVMRGGRAWLQKKDMVRQLQSPDPGSATGPQPEEDDGAASLRLAVELPPVAADLIEAGAWSFYGLAVDVGRRVVRYAVNGDVKESPLGEGEWGCNSLDFLINTGPDAHFSPPRVLDEPLSPGSMQRLYLEARYSFLSIYVGEIKSRLERLAPEEREFSGYSARMVALAPPIVFQKRGTGSSGQAPQCQGKTMEQFNARFLERRSWKCDTPYTCTESISCYAESASASTDSFFGQQAVELEPGENYFPGFAWALEGDSIVRDGKVLNPKADYIDSMTEVVKMYIPFFVPATKVATIAVVAVDISDVKPSVSHEFLQQKILSDSEITWVVGFAVAGIVFACIGVVLAFPAAIQELRDFKHNKLKWMSKKLKRVTPSRLVRLPALRNRRYTANTTQPDVLDVALNTVSRACSNACARAVSRARTVNRIRRRFFPFVTRAPLFAYSSSHILWVCVSRLLLCRCATVPEAQFAVAASCGQLRGDIQPCCLAIQGPTGSLADIWFPAELSLDAGCLRKTSSKFPQCSGTVSSCKSSAVGRPLFFLGPLTLRYGSKGLVILLVVFVTIQVKNNSTAEDIFTSIAGISWSGNLEFQEKVDVFLDAITRAVDVVSVASRPPPASRKPVE